MSLQHSIENDIKAAMLAKKKDELTALRAVKSAILLARTEKGKSEDLDKEQELKLLTKLVKQRVDSAEIYKKENRADLAEKELQELEVIKRYLPAQLSESEIEEKIKTIITTTGATSMKDMGKVMGMASSEMAGKADGKTISTIVKKLLA
ncbi:MAG: GatB/YqeY domain-containing protein [Cyclobacteriaceae bacterium]|nr:GatB/YqeY domain-containing protein [Cyclobacteriaceae bacterium]